MILTGHKLTQALSTPIDSVRLLDSGGNLISTLAASEAVTLIASGQYDVGGSVNRVKYLRQRPGCGLFLVPRPAVDPRVFDVDSDFWEGRGVIHFWRDQRTSLGKAA